jgi:putative transposase
MDRASRRDEAEDGGHYREAGQERAAARVAEALSSEAIGQLVADAKASGMGLDGSEGLLNQMFKAVLERALQTELTEHLGYEKNQAQGRGGGNARNGSYPKTVSSVAGPVQLAVPRDRAGSFEPVIVPKGSRRIGQIDEMILSLYARGMSTRDISSHLQEVYGAACSPGLVSKVTDVIGSEVEAWASRPLDEVYPILYIDALRVKVRHEGSVTNKSAYLVIGVDVDGVKNVLGLWIAEGEGAKFWLHVLTQLKNRGLRDALIVCCDGLKGLPEAIDAVWPQAITQTCVVHLVRAAMRYVAYADQRKVAAALKPVYTAANETAALEALEKVREDWGRRYPGLIDTFERAWEQFIPFLEFDTDIRRVIYTTNTIEAWNRSLRKLLKTSGHFPTDEAAIKLIYLGIRRLEGRHIDGAGKPGTLRGTGTLGWNRAMNQLKIRFGDRLPL